MREALRAHRENPLGTAAIHAYFNVLYWLKGDDLLDAATLDGERFPILQTLKNSFSTAGRDQVRLAPP